MYGLEEVKPPEKRESVDSIETLPPTNLSHVWRQISDIQKELKVNPLNRSQEDVVPSAK